MSKTQVFHRYAGAPDTDVRRMPVARLAAHTSPRTIGELIGRFEKQTESPEERNLYPWAERFLMGYPLAPWQRPIVWDTEQMAQFITSIWMDVDLGSYLVNDLVDYITVDKKVVGTRYLSDVLLDGQQRLTALQEYLLNKFPVPDAEGKPCYWDELGKIERRFFANKTFSLATVRTWDEAELRHIYNLRSFGGVRHTEDQRA